MDKKVFITRILSAIVFGVIMLGGLLFNQLSFIVLTTLICGGCLWEYFGLISTIQSYSERKKKTFRILSTLFGLTAYAFFLFPFLNFFLSGLILMIIPLLFLMFCVELFSGEQRTFQNTSFNLLGIFYISIPFGLLHLIVFFVSDHNCPWFPGKINAVLGLLLLIWTNDTFAYITGSLFGRHKLFSSISPKKSWEGFFGGTIMTLIVAFLISMLLDTIKLQDWIVIALIASVVGTLGDLFESMLKRNLGIKDSGSIMPGHGGFLDRFDAFIFCIPFVFAYLLLTFFL